jgi:hypothetical protein
MKLSKKTKSSVNPVNRPDDAAGMAPAFDVAVDEGEGFPEPLAVVVVDGELLVWVAAVEVLGAAAELLDDDEAVLSSGDMTWRTGVFVSGPIFIAS